MPERETRMSRSVPTALASAGSTKSSLEVQVEIQMPRASVAARVWKSLALPSEPAFDLMSAETLQVAPPSVDSE